MLLITFWWLQKVRERLAVSNQETQKFNVERFNLRKLSELEARKQYQIKISNRYRALENLNDSEGINKAKENVIEHIKPSAKRSLGLFELKQRKLWFGDEYLRFLDQRKQAKVQWLQVTNRNNVDNPNSVNPEASRHFRKRKEEISES